MGAIKSNVVEFVDLVVSDFEPNIEKILNIKVKQTGRDLLISNNRSEVRKRRNDFDLIAGRPTNLNHLTQLLVETRYDFMIVSPTLRLGKRAIRMSKRYETPLVFLANSLFSLNFRNFAKFRKNILLAQKWNGFFAISSGADSHSELRGKEELSSIGILMGLKKNFAEKLVEIPFWISERAEQRKKQISWGIEEV